MGQRVKCPTCGTNFPAQASPGAAPGQPEAVGPGGEGGLNRPPVSRRDDRGWESSSDLIQRARGLLLPPAICLIIVTLPAFLCDSIQMLRALQPPPTRQQFKDQLAKMVNMQMSDEMIDSAIAFSFGQKAVAIASISLILALLAFLAGIMMLARRARWLAILGSVAAMINILNCCCLIGFPVGLWALIVLMREDVAEAFRVS